MTLVLDKGAVALANTLELEQAGLGWFTALPWNQAPEGLRQRPSEELTPLGSAHRGCGRRPSGRWCMANVKVGRVIGQHAAADELLALPGLQQPRLCLLEFIVGFP